MQVKKYRSRDWLYRRFLIDKKTPVEIAEECGVEKITIYRYLEKFQLIKKR